MVLQGKYLCAPWSPFLINDVYILDRVALVALGQSRQCVLADETCDGFQT